MNKTHVMLKSVGCFLSKQACGLTIMHATDLEIFFSLGIYAFQLGNLTQVYTTPHEVACGRMAWLTGWPSCAPRAAADNLRHSTGLSIFACWKLWCSASTCCRKIAAAALQSRLIHAAAAAAASARISVCVLRHDDACWSLGSSP